VVMSVLMDMLVGVGHTVVGVLMGMGMGMLMVVSVTGKMVVMNMHGNILLANFFSIISIKTYLVKTFISGPYPPPGLAETGTNVYNNKKRRGGSVTMSEEHYHYHIHDQEHEHAHAHGLAHTHGHVHENQKAVINRLSRAIGHLEKVKRMVEEGQDCSDVLIQLAAVRSALDNTGKVILKDHMRHCMVDAVAAGDSEAIDDLCQAIDKFMK